MFSKSEKKLLLLVFLAGNVIVGGVTSLCIYLDVLKRPGQAENVVLEVILGGLKLGVPAGLVVASICALVLMVRNRIK